MQPEYYESDKRVKLEIDSVSTTGYNAFLLLWQRWLVNLVVFVTLSLLEFGSELESLQTNAKSYTQDYKCLRFG